MTWTWLGIEPLPHKPGRRQQTSWAKIYFRIRSVATIEPEPFLNRNWNQTSSDLNFDEREFLETWTRSEWPQFSFFMTREINGLQRALGLSRKIERVRERERERENIHEKVREKLREGKVRGWVWLSMSVRLWEKSERERGRGAIFSCFSLFQRLCLPGFISKPVSVSLLSFPSVHELRHEKVRRRERGGCGKFTKTWLKIQQEMAPLKHSVPWGVFPLRLTLKSNFNA